MVNLFFNAGITCEMKWIQDTVNMSGEICLVRKGSTEERDPSVVFSVCKGCRRGEGCELFFTPIVDGLKFETREVWVQH